MTTKSDDKPHRKRLSSTERREEFITKAIEFFAEKGFESSTRGLAKRLGVTQPLLYRYFPSKDELIKEVYQTVYLRRWRDEWDDLLGDRSKPLRLRLQEFYEAYTDAIFTSEWLRIYLYAGLRGVEINRWYMKLVNDQILRPIVAERRNELGKEAQANPSREELELAWTMHGGIFYHGVRKHVFDTCVLEDKSLMISNALDVFLAGFDTVIDQRSPQ